MPMPNYMVDWERLVLDMLPAVLRRPRTVGFIMGLTAPVRRVDGMFADFRRLVSNEIPIGPEVAVLRHYLNERFDFPANRIRILDGTAAEPLRIFTIPEDRPIYLPVFLSAQRIDFTVELPDGLQGFEGEIRRFLDRYKLPTKTYRIVYA